MEELSPEASADALTAATAIGLLQPLQAESTVALRAVTAGRDLTPEPPKEADDPIEDPAQEEEEEAGTNPEEVAPVEEPEEAPAEGSSDPPSDEVVQAPLDGDYEAVVLDVDGKDEAIFPGAESALRIVLSPEGFVADGFVPLTRGEGPSANEFIGKGTVTLVDEETGCEIDWTREMEGAIDASGVGKIDIVDVGEPADPECAGGPDGVGALSIAYRIAVERQTP